MTTSWNNLNPLPWYDSIKRQDFRKWYANGEMFELATPRTNLLPFQLRRINNAATVADITVGLYNPCGEYVRDITADVKAGGLTIEAVNEYFQNIIYRGGVAFTEPLPLGYYYASLSDGVNTWYSELFCVINDIEKLIRLDYWSVENQEYDGGDGLVIYTTGYVNTLYIRSTICRPDYENEDENEKRDGYIFSEKKISKKILSFALYGPEYLADALRIPYLSDFVRVTENGIEYRIFDFLATPKWTDTMYGHYASIGVEMELDTVLKKIQPSSQYVPDVVIAGNVVDYVTGLPTFGARVEIFAGQGPINLLGVAETNRDGYFMFRKFIATGQYPAWLTYRITKADYQIAIPIRSTPPYMQAVKNGIYTNLSIISVADFNVIPEELSFNFLAESQTARFTAPTSAVITSYPEWAVPTIEDGNIIVAVPQNTAPTARNGIIGILLAQNTGIALQLKVSQAALNEVLETFPTLLIWDGNRNLIDALPFICQPAILEMPPDVPEGDDLSKSVIFYGRLQGVVTMESSEEWCYPIDSPASPGWGHTMDIHATPNISGAPRSAIITVTQNTVTQKIPVFQNIIV